MPISATVRELDEWRTSTRMHGRIRLLTWEKSFAKTAKPLFTGSIPIAASNKIDRSKDFSYRSGVHQIRGAEDRAIPKN
jgi:hypothetical protein